VLYVADQLREEKGTHFDVPPRQVEDRLRHRLVLLVTALGGRLEDLLLAVRRQKAHDVVLWHRDSFALLLEHGLPGVFPDQVDALGNAALDQIGEELVGVLEVRLLDRVAHSVA